MRSACSNLILLAALCSRSGAQPGVSEAAFSRSSHAIQAFSKTGNITIPVTRLQLDIRYPIRKHERADLIVVYDPETGHYIWRVTPLRGPQDTTSFLTEIEEGRLAFYLAADDMTEFHVGSDLYVKSHRDIASDLWTAERASLTAIERGLADYENRGFHTDSKAVSLRAIPQDFNCEPGNSFCGPAIKITSIGKEDSNWRLVLHSRWSQVFVLNSAFEFVRTERLLKPLP